jgi:signal transduction histidine kinase
VSATTVAPLAAVPRRRLATAPLAVASATVAAGGAVAAAALPALGALDPFALAVCVLLVVLARVRTVALFDRSSFAVSVVPVLAAGMLLGVPGAAAVALVSGVAHALVRRLVWYKALFNCGNYVLGAALAATVFHLASPRLAAEDLPFLVPLAAGAGLAHFAHTLPLAVVIAGEHRVRPHEAWLEHFAWLWPQYAVLGVLALLLALACRLFGPWGAAAFLAPPAMMLLTAKQYIDRTTESVRRLRALNDELRGLNAELTDEIRQREAAEAENARLAHEAARTAALEETNELKSRFISIASHELRTPLTAVVGYTELALTATPADDQRHGLLRMAHQGALQLVELVDNLLDTSRIELGKMAVHPEPVDLEHALPPVFDTLRAGTSAHALVSAVAPQARWVRADPARLRQILTNLVGNAVKYSPAGGQVLVAARAVAPGSVELSVSDQGLGIPAEQLGRIFDPYQRVDLSVKRKIKGTGLGLYIVRHLVELHGGTVRVESALGQGSTFTISLPSAEPAPAAADAAARADLAVA